MQTPDSSPAPVSTAPAAAVPEAGSAAAGAAAEAGVEWVLSLACPDRAGIVHAVSGMLVELEATITESQQFGSPDSHQFFLRMQFRTHTSEADIRAALSPVAQRLDFTAELHRADRRLRTLVMVSKAGHCLNDLLFHTGTGALPINIAAVAGNHTLLAPMAEHAGVPFHHIPVTAETKAEAEAALLALVEEYDIELVVLARYMQVLSPALCERMAGRIINIHHSFLPSFKGARPYHQAHDRGVKIIGATAHYVTDDLDEGPIIEQDVVRVEHRHSPAQFIRFGQDVEAAVLSRAVGWHAEGRVLLDGNRTVVFD